MKWMRGEGWRDPLGVAMLLVALVLLAVAWHGTAAAPSLQVTHWPVSPAAH
ncbi:MAG TPA: hypothetical protein VNL35_10060 [Chloroflexota bacterium]|nr:hypothetical protein [Chloroflexota bacterium]